MKNVLIVDDIVINRILLTELVKKLGYKHQHAANGKEAIEALQSRNIDIVLMDIEMPVMNGVEATHYIRKQLKPPLSEIPVIALTAHNPDDFFDTFEEAGFDDLITKPYLLDKISLAIDSALSKV